MQRNMNRSIPAGEAMDIAKQVLLAMLMLILLSVLIPARAEEAVSPMIVSETADSPEYPALEAEHPARSQQMLLPAHICQRFGPQALRQWFVHCVSLPCRGIPQCFL